ncbi:hypothetical protein L9F63_008141, partial [Diploptera punctata]
LCLVMQSHIFLITILVLQFYRNKNTSPVLQYNLLPVFVAPEAFFMVNSTLSN